MPGSKAEFCPFSGCAPLSNSAAWGGGKSFGFAAFQRWEQVAMNGARKQPERAP
jgi:hypothetical protein